MRQYKIQLKELLIESGWTLQEVDDETDWWLEELWTIVSSKQNWGYTLYLHFLVDLQYEGRNKSSAVSTISVSPKRAENYIEANDEVAEMWLQKGRYNENLKKFVEQINQHRNEKDL